jgi:hypothetical protein
VDSAWDGVVIWRFAYGSRGDGSRELSPQGICSPHKGSPRSVAAGDSEQET